jgi:hypothetical protein
MKKKNPSVGPGITRPRMVFAMTQSLHHTLQLIRGTLLCGDRMEAAVGTKLAGMHPIHGMRADMIHLRPSSESDLGRVAMDNTSGI